MSGLRDEDMKRLYKGTHQINDMAATPGDTARGVTLLL